MDEDKVFGTRLSESERRYLDNHFDGKFSEYVHNSFKRDIEFSNHNTRVDRRVKFFSPFLKICFGFILVLMTWGIPGWIGKTLALLIGIYFLSNGVYIFSRYVHGVKDA